MGNYHPHGDGAIYDALVRMAQDWVMRVPLVHGAGQLRLGRRRPARRLPLHRGQAHRGRRAAAERTATSETVDLRPNYDGNRQEPVVLPAQFPNLLVNGTSGIAVGMATNIPPHNLGEVLPRLRPPDREPGRDDVAQLLDKVKGPDFPLGGKIVTDRAHAAQDLRGGHAAASRCRASGRRRSRQGKQQIVVTSIPYGVDKGELEQTIGAIIEERKLPQLLDLIERVEREGRPAASPWR